jgi:hypothetical protein
MDQFITLPFLSGWGGARGPLELKIVKLIQDAINKTEKLTKYDL